MQRTAYPMRRRFGTRAVVVALCAGLAAGYMTPAVAEPLGQYTTFDVGPGAWYAGGIASGPDGNMWFTNNANFSVNVLTANGSVTSFPVPTSPSLTSGPGLFEVAAGPDGNMWFTGFFANYVGKVTPAGVVTTYSVPIADSHPEGITAGPDGNMWFTLDFANGIGRITPAGEMTLFPIPDPGVTGAPAISVTTACPMCPNQIVAGPQESLWFTLPAVNLIGRMTVDGALTTFPIATATKPSDAGTWATLGDITSGPDGNLWILQAADSKVSRMTPDGVVTDFALPANAEHPVTITRGPQSTLWVAPGRGTALARLDVSKTTASVTITSYPLPSANSNPGSAATGPDGGVWFTNLVASPSWTDFAEQIGRIGTGVGPILTARLTNAGQTATTARVGSPLTCAHVNRSGWRQTQVRYQWLRDGKPMMEGVRRTYTPRARDKGRKINCNVAVTYAHALNTLGANSQAMLVR